MRAAALIAALAAPVPGLATAEPPSLALPVDCALGDTCFIQQYVDRDPGPGARDFTCGSLSYDGHKGTDFAVPTVRAALRGVNVVAAADGTVRGLRDGEADHFDDPEDSGTAGRDCGNGVVLDHGDGWQTQYCHMMNGSVAVREGQRVQAGTVLGRIGMSGRAAFPHLHLSVRHDGAVVDPFAVDGVSTCGAAADALWAVELPYVAGGLIDAGFSDGVPSFEAIRLGEAHQALLEADAAALVFWVHAFGARIGDQLRLRVHGPRGVFSDQTVTLERTQARLFRASGRHLGADNRLPGRYTGTAILIRDGGEIGRMVAETVLRD